METSIAKQKKQLPKLADLINPEVFNAKQNDLQVLLNQEPPASWIKKNKFANNSIYLPIDKIEYLLTSIFGRWWVEVIEWKVVANSVGAHVRLFFVDPITGETMHMDGLGAMPIQTDEGKGATDFNYVKTSAVQMALPGAESYAFKDAAEKLGRIFGKDLNRKDLMDYTSMSGRYSKPEAKEDHDLTAIIEGVAQCHDKVELKKYFDQIKNNMPISPEISAIFSQRKNEITNGNRAA